MSDIPPELLQQLIDQYMADQGGMADYGMADFGVDPYGATGEMLSGDDVNFTDAIPSYDLEGDPYTLNQQFNQLQDFNQLIADPVFQGLGGPGAWSSTAFEPQVAWEQVESPEYTRWQNYLNTPTSFEGMIALELQEGGTPLSAVRKIQNRVNANPEGPLAQELGALFAPRDEFGPTGEGVDWGAISEAATAIDELRSQIPAVGAQGQTVAPDGTVVPGGEIVESVGADGRPILLRRTEEPSALQEKFADLGLPSPYEQYTAESFMPPEFFDEASAFEPAYAQYAESDQAVQDAMQAYRGYVPREWGERERPDTADQPSANYLGTSDDELVGGPGVGYTDEDPQQGAMRDWLSRATDGWGGTAEPPSLNEALQIEDPAEFLQWYNTYGNQMNDDERAEVITRVTDRVASGAAGPMGTPAGSEFAAGWDPVLQAISDDYGGVVDEPSEPDVPATDALTQALGIPSPTEFRRYVLNHPELAGREAELAGHASQQAQVAGGEDSALWGELQNQLIGGNLTSRATQTGGGGGNAFRFRVPGGDDGPPSPIDVIAADNNDNEPGPITTLSDQWRDQVFGAFDDEAPEPAPPSPSDMLAEQWREQVFGQAAQPAPREWLTTEQALSSPLADLRSQRRQAPRPGVTRPQREPEGPLGSQQQVSTRPPSSAVLRPQRNPDRGGPMYDAMLAHIRTGERRNDEVTQAPVSERRTGEESQRGRRTDEQRRQQARERAPRESQGERYSVLGGFSGTGRLGRSQRARSERARQSRQLMNMREQTYGPSWGSAMAAAYLAQQRGTTPLQQVYAQRVQNIRRAGPATRARPQIVSY